MEFVQAFFAPRRQTVFEEHDSADSLSEASNAHSRIDADVSTTTERLSRDKLNGLEAKENGDGVVYQHHDLPGDDSVSPYPHGVATETVTTVPSTLDQQDTDSLAAVRAKANERAAGTGNPVVADAQTMLMTSNSRPGPEHVAQLYAICIRRGIPLVFSFSEQGAQRFSAELTLGEGETVTVLRTPPVFSNKKDAKARAAEMAFPIIQNMGHEKSSKTDNSSQANVVEGAANENWIGKLFEYCQASNSSYPTWTEYHVGHRHACELALSPPRMTSGRTTQIFGSSAHAYQTKHAARVAAAQQAMEWLAANWGVPRTKKQARTDRVGSEAPGLATATPQAASPKTSQNLVVQETRIDAPDEARSGVHVNELCCALNLPCPVYDLRVAPDTALNEALYNGVAYLPPGIGGLPAMMLTVPMSTKAGVGLNVVNGIDRENILQSAASITSSNEIVLGTVSRIFGKKNAKDALAHEVLTALRLEKTTRLEMAKEMARTARGDTTVA